MTMPPIPKGTLTSKIEEATKIKEQIRAAVIAERESCALIVELVLQVKPKDANPTSKALVDVLHDAARITAAAIRGRP